MNFNLTVIRLHFHLPTADHASSPAKVIENCSKLYKQHSELQNLKTLGILHDREYANEKETIMDLLNNSRANLI